MINKKIRRCDIVEDRKGEWERVCLEFVSLLSTTGCRNFLLNNHCYDFHIIFLSKEHSLERTPKMIS